MLLAFLVLPGARSCAPARGGTRPVLSAFGRFCLNLQMRVQCVVMIGLVQPIFLWKIVSCPAVKQQTATNANHPV